MVDFPTVLVPDDISAVTTKLGDLSKSHTDHHQAIDERLGELQAILNQATGVITWQGIVGQTDPLLDLQDSDANSRLVVTPDDGITTVDIKAGSSVGVGFNMFAEDDSTKEVSWASSAFVTVAAVDYGGQVTADAHVNDDGSNGGVTLNAVLNPGTGLASLVYTADSSGGGLTLVGGAAQTTGVLDAQASDTNSIIKVTGDKKLGFYNKAPVALQTGVAVNAAGIHAALVNLGLITA